MESAVQQQLWDDYIASRKAQGGSETIQLRNRLVEEYQPLVMAIAWKQARQLPKSILIDDLIAYGNIGLINAIEKFDPQRGAPFQSFAKLKIWGKMIDSLREESFTPRSVRLKERKRNPKSIVSETYQDQPVQLSFLLEEKHMERSTYRDRSVEEIICDYREHRPDSQLVFLECKHACTRGLTEIEKEVVDRFYFDGELQSVIANRLGRSESRISQIRKSCIAKVQAAVLEMLDLEIESPDDSGTPETIEEQLCH